VASSFRQIILKNYKYVILGAGPSGLTVAHALLNAGIRRQDLLVIEKEGVAGGLCRSEMVDGASLDVGGGHFLDVRRKEVLDFLFRFMPQSEWNLFERVSRIRLRAQEIEHPLEANLWQLSKEDQVDYLESIARAGSVRGEPQPTAFADWVTWKLGDRIAQEYMLPYNRKIWAMDPNMLGTYWLYKLPDVSFRETLRSCLEGRPFGALPAHGTFYYPKSHGYGEVWRRMGEALGDGLVSNCTVESVDIATRTVNGRWSADTLITTIPWTLWQGFAALPDDISKHIGRLKNVPIDVDYVPATLDNPSHWIYEPDESISYHRMLLRSNFCTGAKGYWTETNAARSGAPASFRHRNEFAYPVNTIGKPEAIAEVLKWASSRSIVGIGRWGKWEHMNSDVAVAEALAAARSLAGA
jgi:protoporphyrinogen oxidase